MNSPPNLIRLTNPRVIRGEALSPRSVNKLNLNPNNLWADTRSSRKILKPKPNKKKTKGGRKKRTRKKRGGVWGPDLMLSAGLPVSEVEDWQFEPVPASHGRIISENRISINQIISAINDCHPGGCPGPAVAVPVQLPVANPMPPLPPPPGQRRARVEGGSRRKKRTRRRKKRTRRRRRRTRKKRGKGPQQRAVAGKFVGNILSKYKPKAKPKARRKKSHTAKKADHAPRAPPQRPVYPDIVEVQESILSLSPTFEQVSNEYYGGDHGPKWFLARVTGGDVGAGGGHFYFLGRRGYQIQLLNAAGEDAGQGLQYVAQVRAQDGRTYTWRGPAN
jgi:hypothetical protein